MIAKKMKILFLATHPTQYSAPMFRKYSQDPDIEIEVFFYSLKGAEEYFDKDFNTSLKWDIDVMGGYKHTLLRNWSPFLKGKSFFSLINFRLFRNIRNSKPDVIISFCGYVYFSFWISIFVAKILRIPFYFGTDASSIESRDGSRLKPFLKKIILPWIFSFSKRILAPSCATIKFLKSIGIAESRIAYSPAVIDDIWWKTEAGIIDKDKSRRKYNIKSDELLYVFCAKLQNWKRPQDAINAFIKAGLKKSKLILIGEGNLKSSLIKTIQDNSVNEKIQLVGFKNQSELPEFFSMADFLILPSEYEPGGVVVIESMICGCVPILSDHVGHCYDFVEHGRTGFSFQRYSVDQLAEIFKSLEDGKYDLSELRRNATQKISSITLDNHLELTKKMIFQDS